MLDLRIRDGLLLDGTGAAPQRGDLGIRDGRIVAVGRVLQEVELDEEEEVGDAEDGTAVGGKDGRREALRGRVQEGSGGRAAPQFGGPRGWRQVAAPLRGGARALDTPSPPTPLQP